MGNFCQGIQSSNNPICVALVTNTIGDPDSALRILHSELFPMTKILVTGAAGFIGFHVSRRLLARGDTVIGLDSVNDYYDVRLKHARLAQLQGEPGFSFHQLELGNREGIDRVFAGDRPQRVVNLAAQAGVRYSLTNPHAYVDSNLTGFMNILEGCRHNGVEHLVYASSVSGLWGQHEDASFRSIRTSTIR